LVNLTLAILRKAELGFLGVVVATFTHTPLLKGELLLTGLFFKELKEKVKAGDFGFFLLLFLLFRFN
jgi:hypothetical protein